jgi:hypothetical protein
VNPEAQAIFDKVVKKNPRDLSDDEINFIHARKPYLNDEQLRIFKDVLEKREAEIKALTNPEPPIYVSKKDRKK